MSLYDEGASPDRAEVAALDRAMKSLRDELALTTRAHDILDAAGVTKFDANTGEEYSIIGRAHAVVAEVVALRADNDDLRKQHNDAALILDRYKQEINALRAEVERLTIACDRNADIVVKLSDQREKLEYKLTTAEDTIEKMQGVVEAANNRKDALDAYESAAADGSDDQMREASEVYDAADDAFNKALATLREG